MRKERIKGTLVPLFYRVKVLLKVHLKMVLKKLLKK